MLSTLKRLFGLSLIYVVGDILARGISFFLLPLYTRHMSPDYYGILGLASMLSQLLIMLLSFSAYGVVQRFYYQYSDAAERKAFLGSFWLFLIIVPGGVLGGLFAFGEPVFRIALPELPFHPYVQLVLAAAYLNIVSEPILVTLFRVREQAGRYVAFSLATLLLGMGLSVWFVVVQGEGAVGALHAQIGAAVAMAIVAILILRRETLLKWRRQSVQAALAFGLPLVPHFVAHWVLSVSDRAILQRFVPLDQLGLYSLAYQFGMGYQMIAASVNYSFSPMFSRAATSDSEFAALGRIATYYLLAIAGLGVAVALMAGNLIILITPAAYHNAGGLVPWIVVGIFALSAYYLPMNTLSMTVGQTRQIPLITMLAGAVNIGLNLLWIPHWGVLAAALSTAVGYVILAVLVFVVAQRTKPLAYEKGRIAKIGLACLVVFGLGRLAMRADPLLNLLIGLSLVGSLPLLLWAFGFWTDGERGMAAQMWQRLVRRGLAVKMTP